MIRLKASKTFDCKTVSDWIHSSHKEREDNKIIFFMCSIAPSCKIPGLLQNKEASRIEIDVEKGDISIWFLAHNPKADILIKGAIS